MAQRSKVFEKWSTAKFPLANTAVAEKGHVACFAGDGTVTPMDAGDTALTAIGWFAQDLTGDGTAPVLVDLFEEKTLVFFLNDSVAPLDAGDVGSPCYMLSSATVSADSDTNANAVAGTVWQVTSEGVLVDVR